MRSLFNVHDQHVSEMKIPLLPLFLSCNKKKKEKKSEKPSPPTHTHTHDFLFLFCQTTENQVGLPRRHSISQDSRRQWWMRHQRKRNKTASAKKRWTSMWSPNVTFRVPARTLFSRDRTSEVCICEISTFIYHVDGNCFNSLLVTSFFFFAMAWAIATMLHSWLLCYMMQRYDVWADCRGIASHQPYIFSILYSSLSYMHQEHGRDVEYVICKEGTEQAKKEEAVTSPHRTAKTATPTMESESNQNKQRA